MSAFTTVQEHLRQMITNADEICKVRNPWRQDADTTLQTELRYMFIDEHQEWVLIDTQDTCIKFDFIYFATGESHSTRYYTIQIDFSESGDISSLTCRNESDLGRPYDCELSGIKMSFKSEDIRTLLNIL